MRRSGVTREPTRAPADSISNERVALAFVEGFDAFGGALQRRQHRHGDVGGLLRATVRILSLQRSELAPLELFRERANRASPPCRTVAITSRAASSIACGTDALRRLSDCKSRFVVPMLRSRKRMSEAGEHRGLPGSKNHRDTPTGLGWRNTSFAFCRAVGARGRNRRDAVDFFVQNR